MGCRHSYLSCDNHVSLIQSPNDSSEKRGSPSSNPRREEERPPHPSGWQRCKGIHKVVREHLCSLVGTTQETLIPDPGWWSPRLSLEWFYIHAKRISSSLSTCKLCGIEILYIMHSESPTPYISLQKLTGIFLELVCAFWNARCFASTDKSATSSFCLLGWSQKLMHSCKSDNTQPTHLVPLWDTCVPEPGRCWQLLPWPLEVISLCLLSQCWMVLSPFSPC